MNPSERGIANDRVSSVMHRYPFVIISCLAVFGVMLDAWWYNQWQASLVGWGSWMTIALVVSAINYLLESKPAAMRQRWKGSHLPAAMLLVAFAGIWHAGFERSYRSASLLQLVEDQSEQPVVLRGRLRRTVSLRPNPIAYGSASRDAAMYRSELTVGLDQVRTSSGYQPIDGTVLVYVDGDQSHLRPGDHLEIYGWLKSFPVPTNPGESDLRPTYRRRGLHARVETKNASAITVTKSHRSSLHAWVSTLATSGRESLLRHTDERTGPLAVALVIGQREFVDSKTRDALLATGTAHLLSVSGMHLAILVLVASWMISAFGLQPIWKLMVIGAISALYVAVTGGRPPVIRAALLISMLLLSTCFRRTSQPLNTLGIAALILIIANPRNVFSVGVHLSFLAVITLMLAGRTLMTGSNAADQELKREASFQSLIDQSHSRWIMWARSVGRFFGQMAWLSGCVTAVSMPLVWSQFHIVSLVSVMTNVMVWGGLMVALPTGVLTVIVDPIHPVLGIVPGALCHLALASMWWIIDWMYHLPGGHWWLPSPPVWMVVIFYVSLASTLFLRGRQTRITRCVWMIGWMVVAVFIATRPAALPKDSLEATFVDVGHGTSVIVRLPDGRVWLYDCGRMGNAVGTSRDIDTALWDLGVTRLDALFLSHADSDHYNALPAILQRFVVDRIVIPPGMLQRDPERLADLRAAIARYEVPVHEMGADGELSAVLNQASSARVLHPPNGFSEGNDNANSLVLQVVHAGTSFILPGDLEPPGTGVLIHRPRPKAGGVLMAPHHGSLTMDAEAVLTWARPAETIVSGSRRAARVEVAEMLSVTGSGVHVTARQGAIRVRIDAAGKIDVRGWLDRGGWDGTVLPR